MITFELPITKHAPFNSEEYFEVRFKTIAGKGSTPYMAYKNLHDALEHAQERFDVYISYALHGLDNTVFLCIDENKAFYLS